MKKLKMALSHIRSRLLELGRNERGGAEIVAIVLILVVVVALAVIFRNELQDLITRIIRQISGEISTFENTP